MKNNSISEFYKILIKGVDKHSNNQVEFESEIIRIDKKREIEYEFVSSINITGSFNGELFLFASKETLNLIFQLVYNTDYSTLENDNLIQSSMDEFLNLIIANCTEEFSGANIPIEIGVPVKIIHENFSSILTSIENGIILNTPVGQMLLTFVNKIDI